MRQCAKSLALLRGQLVGLSNEFKGNIDLVHSLQPIDDSALMLRIDDELVVCRIAWKLIAMGAFSQRLTHAEAREQNVNRNARR